MKKIALVGGTFDPIHTGHIAFCHAVQSYVAMDRGLLIPCANPPHKEGVTPAAQRVAMLEMCMRHISRWELSLCELERAGPSYSIDTLVHMRERFGQQAAIYFALGVDAFSQLHHWQDWQRFCELVHVVIVQRANYVWDEKQWDAPLRQFYRRHYSNMCSTRDGTHGKIYHCEMPPYTVSSTGIRQMIEKGGSATLCSEYLLPEVIAYIEKQRLYRPPSNR